MTEQVVITEGEIKEEIPQTDAAKVKYANTLFEQAKKYRQNYAKHISIENLKWYKGEQYNPDMQLAAHDYVVSNRIFATIENVLPILTDNRPKFYFGALEPSDQPKADVMNKVIGDYLWTQMDMDLKLPENGKNVLIYGTAFMRPYWDSAVKGGIGDVRVRVYSPFAIFPAPGYPELDDNIPYYIIADYISIQELRKRYPERAGSIRPTTSRDNQIPDPAKDTNSGGQNNTAQVSDTTGSQTEYQPVSGSGAGEEDSKVLVLEAHINDENKDLFPNGRVLVTTGDVVLEDGPSQIPCYPDVVKFIDMVLPGEFWGMGEVIQLKDPQKMINKFKSAIVNILRFTSDPPLLVDVGAIDDDDLDNYINEPGIIIEKAAGTEVRWLEMKMPDVGLINYISECEKEINLISGVQEYSAPSHGGLPSGASLYQLQEIGQTRIRLKVRNMQAALQKLGRMILKIALEFYTEPRTARIIGADGKPSYLKIYREKNPQLDAAMMTQLQAQGMQGVNLATIDPDMDLTVTIEPAMPLNRSAKLEMASNLFKLGVIDQQAVLDMGDIPDKEKILARMAQSNQAKIQGEIQKAMLEAKTQTFPKLSLGLKGDDLTPDEKGQIIQSFGIKPHPARGVDNGKRQETTTASAPQAAPPQ
jgi:hypothetical protein